MENSANLKAGGITPKLMQRELQAQLHATMKDYEQFISESEQDVAQTQSELDQLQQELAKEVRITNSLLEEKKMNDAQL